MALSFDGSSYLSLDLSGTGPISAYPFTMVAWIKPPQEKKDWQAFVLSDGTETARAGIGPANYGRWGMYWKSVEMRSASSFSENYGTASPNPWSHQAVIFASQSSRTSYVNGTGNSFSNSSNNAQTLTDMDIIGIGYGPTAGNNALMKGEMAECALYNVALDDKDINALHAGFSPLFIKPDSLIGYWPLGGPFAGASSGVDVTGLRNLSVTGTLTETKHPQVYYPTLSTRTRVAAEPAPVVPGQGHDYALPGNLVDYAIDNKQDYQAPRQAADYGVPPDGI
jgi:hypothetical protein